MNKKILCPLLCCLALFSACDNTSEDERQTVEISAKHTVLLEEYAGQYCRYCPRAANYVSQLKSVLKERLIVVTIHVGSLASDSLRSSAGEMYFRRFGGAYLPSGTIDRAAISGEIINDDDSQWGYYVKKRAEQQDLPDVELQLESSFNAADSTISVYAVTSGTASGFTPRLQLYLTESHITGFQYTESGIEQNYEHNHILRDALNGTWGEEVELNKEYNRTFSVLKGKSWNKDNLSIVGFIYNADTDEVLYATEISLGD
ncbi:hypothetical protein FACS189434_12740 [Bacteroidia bacterium]|nr:hypothetical protein FACS189434_12740 [Bacteroidia bacterium]